MLKYTQTVLKKLSFDEVLFKKELLKSFRWLNSDEIYLLEDWCFSEFGNSHKEIILEVFEN